MLQKIYKAKNLEEFLGILGIAYLLAVAALTVVLVNFLVSSMAVVFKGRVIAATDVPRFELEKAEEALGRQTSINL